MISRNIFSRTILVVSALALAVSLRAQTPVIISVDAKNPGAAISPTFSGLSFEMSQLFADDDGTNYFRPDNQALISLFRTLGIKDLRVGGNTADRNFRGLPERGDIDNLFAFARAANVKVIYCLQLRDGNAQTDAAEAKYIMDRYADQVDSFSIGQEPNVYPKTTNAMGVVTPRPPYSDYAKRWKDFETVIVAAVPNIRLCGPSVDDNPEWPQEFMHDFGEGDNVAMITAHLYPGRSGEKVPSPDVGRDRMLSGDFIDAYQKLYDGFAVTAMLDGLPYRLEEVNNYFNGGATDVSDTFASALWGLDFMYWWAQHGAAGLNFHTGDRVGSSEGMRVSRYTAYFSTPDGFMVRPLGYGIKAFDIGWHGRFAPATISNPLQLNLSVYAVLGDDKNLYVTIINKEHGSHPRDASIALCADGFVGAQTMALTAPGNDVTAKDGTTLGGSKIDDSGSWDGKWTDPLSSKSGAFNVQVPAGSALIVELLQN
jgi:hypothetical protein